MQFLMYLFFFLIILVICLFPLVVAPSSAEDAERLAYLAKFRTSNESENSPQ